MSGSSTFRHVLLSNVVPLCGDSFSGVWLPTVAHLPFHHLGKYVWIFNYLAQCGIILWCSRWDLNPHTRRHTHLKRTCLPFHHPSVSTPNLLWILDFFLGIHVPCTARVSLAPLEDLPFHHPSKNPTIRASWIIEKMERKANKNSQLNWEFLEHDYTISFSKTHTMASLLKKSIVRRISLSIVITR